MRQIIEQMLDGVEKPARYLGNEWNAVHKSDPDLTRVALAFPDVYEVGMSHLGLQILYHIVNRRSDAVAERVFAPWVDMEQAMREANLPLFSLESWSPLQSFHLIGFTLQYEMSYSNILNMLELAGVPMLAALRQETDPLVMAGGPCAYNPEPIADFFDFIVLGEAEEALDEVLTVYADCRRREQSRAATLAALAGIPGVYVPALHQVTYHDDGTILSVQTDGGQSLVKKRVLAELRPEYYPTEPIVPYLGVVHDRLMLEVFRGCTRGCRFCQAGMIYRPVRERTRDELLALAQAALRSSGYDEVSLMSLSTMDYSDLAGLLESMLAEGSGCEQVKISLPSLRADSFSVELADKVRQNRRSGLTLAPEAGSQRLRDVINKQVTEQDLLTAVAGAERSGWQGVKLYFMIGLPTETDEDLVGIFQLAQKAAYAYKYVGQPGHPLRVTVSVASFVPKAWTPFQWSPQDSLAELERKQLLLRQLFAKDRRLKLNYHDADLSFLEAIFARGDRRLSQVLLVAHRLGCRFDGWSEFFSFSRWMQAFAEAEVDPTFYANRQRPQTEVLPWDHLSPGIDREWLWQEREAAFSGQTTPDCRQDNCPLCGACQQLPASTSLARGVTP